MLIKIIANLRKCSIKKLIKNSEKILRALWEENKLFLISCCFSVKLIILEKKIIEDQYSAIFCFLLKLIEQPVYLI